MLIAAPKNNEERKRFKEFMNTPPQKVTSRYARNLLIKGKNYEFQLRNVLINFNMVDQVNTGQYYIVVLHDNDGHAREAVGVTPEQAIHRCLEKHGVTFR